MSVGKERDLRDAQPFVKRNTQLAISAQSGSNSGNSGNSGCGGCNGSGCSDCRAVVSKTNSLSGDENRIEQSSANPSKIKAIKSEPLPKIPQNRPLSK